MVASPIVAVDTFLHEIVRFSILLAERVCSYLQSLCKRPFRVVAGVRVAVYLKGINYLIILSLPFGSLRDCSRKEPLCLPLKPPCNRSSEGGRQRSRPDAWKASDSGFPLQMNMCSRLDTEGRRCNTLVSPSRACCWHPVITMRWPSQNKR